MAAKRRTTIGPSSGDPESQRYNWETSDEENAHAAFTRWADMVRERPSAIERRKRNLLHASLYSNLPLLGFGVNNYTRNVPHQGRIAINATQNAIDSLVSKVCKNRPRPMFTTVEGDFELREKAENADKCVDGHFHNQDYYTEAHAGRVLDCAIYGLGVTKTHEVDGEAVVDRTFPWEVIADDRECLYGKPVHIGQRKYYDMQECFDLFRRSGKGDKKWNDELQEAIESRAQQMDAEFQDFDRDETSEQIVVYEGYRLPTAKRPGKKIICIRGKTIKFEDWTDKETPYTFVRPKVQAMGLYGIGICERVAGIQAEINRLVRDIQMAMHLIAKPHWMIEASSMVNTASLNNDIATIIKYSGAVPPQVYTPQSMSSEVFTHLQFLIRTLYEVSGISQLSASSQKPAGLSSAVALRTYLNAETEYFNDFVQSVERAASKDAMKFAKVLAKIGSKKPVLAQSGYKGRTIEQVTWKPMDFDTIAVQIYPTSKLPDTPTGKREYALELAQYTQVSDDDIYEMLEWDDTEAFARRRLAPKRNVERDIMRIRRGEKVIRDAIGNHKMAFMMMTDAYEEAKHDKLPQERLAVMRNYIKACYRYMNGKAGPGSDTQPAPVAPPMGPGGPLMPPGAGPPPVVPPGMLPEPMPPPIPGPMNGAPPMPPPM